MRLSAKHRRRRATAAVVVFMLLFALLGLTAVVVDLGLARLTQYEMQTAADCAALEGLRFRDDPSVTDLTLRDMTRRQGASSLVGFVFDDDFDPGNGDPMQFGAGPIVNLSTGQGGNANAAQTITVPVPPVYDPVLQLNLANAKAGDLVSGTFDSTATTHLESDLYDRTDFTPDPAGTSPPGNAFLVRLRRTNDLQSLDNQPGISSAEAALPFLFGRGTVMQASDPAAGYAPRFHGITVRATAIADARRVLSVGPAYPATMYMAADPTFPGIQGATPFALTSAFWQTPTAGPYTVNTAGVIADGTGSPIGQMTRVSSLAADLAASDTTLTVASALGFPTTGAFRIRIQDELLLVTAGSGTTTWTVQRGLEGTTAAAHATSSPVISQEVLSVGQTFAAVASAAPADLRLFTATEIAAHIYVPIYDPVSGSVIGFGLLTWAPDPTVANGFVTIAPQPGVVAVRNATGILAQPMPTLTALPSPPPNTLLAPVLVR